MNLKEFIDSVKEREAKAMPGPYELRVREFSNTAKEEIWTNLGWLSQLPGDYRSPTNEFFIAAKQDIPTLLKIVEEQAKALDEIISWCPEPTKDGHCLVAECETARQAQLAVAKILEERGK